MVQNPTEKRYKCTVYITYEFMVTAETADDAENNVFDTIADDISKGVIPMDIYDSDGCFPVPLLKSLDIVPAVNENE
jgi:hypothetical protein